ncbi:hypothetical protein BSKO_04381 [Bryopsis sp. KO-2023]|nr:hypothetical protein BSKO_04381 [Bryopsis sp. KO-2023]
MGELTNRAVVVTRFSKENPADVVSVRELPMPSVGPKDVMIRMTLRPINPSDLLALQGYQHGYNPTFPAVPGSEGTGVVVEVGEETSLLPIGIRVVPICFHPWTAGYGSWQQYVVLPESHVIPVDDNVSDESASQFVVNPLTALGMLEDLNVPDGEYLLSTAAGSVLGRQLIALAKHLDVKTINVVRRRELVKELADLGGDEVVCSATENITERVREITGGRMAYAAVDAVAGNMTGKVVSSVRNNGTVYLYGWLSGFQLEGINAADLMFRGVTVTGWYLPSWLERLGETEVVRRAVAIMKLMDNNVLVPYSGKKFPLERVQEAIRASRQAARGGKVLLQG